MSALLRLPREEQQRRVEYIARRHGQTQKAAREFLESLDGPGVLLVGIDARLARSPEKPYDPMSEMFVLR